MSSLLPGDVVYCKINDSFIVYSCVDAFDSLESFEIVSLIDGGYMVKVPSGIFLTNSILADECKVKEYFIPVNFTGSYVHFITDSHISSIKSRKDGECCDRCKEFFPFAVKDPDGEFKCFLCRRYPYR